MLEKKRPRVILLEDNDAILQSANAILSQQGWDVTCEQESKKALATLQESKDGPFALFISNFKLPKMEGDDVLKFVKKISPLTQRMLMISSEEPDILIDAINKAEINACITAPFKAEDLIDQTRNCFRHFKSEIKRRRLKRVTVHQNKQMFKVAQKLRKKDESAQKKIANKKQKLFKLNSKIRALESKKELNSDISLSTFIDHKDITPDKDNFKAEFTELSGNIKSVFDAFSSHKKIPVSDLDMGRIFSTSERSQTSDEVTPDEQAPDEVTPDEQAPDEVTPDEQATDGENEKETQDSETSLPEDDNRINPDIFDTIVKFALLQSLGKPAADPNSAPPEVQDDHPDEALDALFEIRISDSQTQAWIKRKKSNDPQSAPDVTDILDWLSKKMISYGILGDDSIETWAKKSKVDEIVIAQGEDPVFGRPGVVIYHFETDFTNPGKINEDGSIDFRDRGDIPFVQADTLLAKKVPAKQGTPGISIAGIPIPVDEVEDPVFEAGSGVTQSEDSLSIYAQIDGQPHVDAMGTISVNPELVIQGDVDFETGNIDFNGNIIVKGMIKEGFLVKGVNLTVQEIEGATIELSGDLNVSAGINDATISVQGNIYAKFLNNSTVMGFGDLSISKEIIDSNILLSGTCQNDSGHIISSHICAKLGVTAGNIGTAASKPSQFKIGTDEHILTLTSKIDESLETSVNKTNLLKNDIKALEDEDQELYQKISEKAHVQDRSQIEIKKIKESMPELEKSNDMIKVSKATDQIKKLVEKAKQAETELNDIFETQDRIAKQIEQIKNQLNILQDKNKALVLEKRTLTNFSKKHAPTPQISVNNTIAQDTIIKAPHASIVIKEDTSKCKIVEIEKKDEGVQFFEIAFADL